MEIWLPDSETKVLVDPAGNVRIWDEMVMTKTSIEKKKIGFTQLDNDLGSSNGRMLGSDPGDRGSNP